MSKTITVKTDLANYDEMFARVISDLKGYRVNQLQKISKANSRLITRYLDSKLKERNLKPATRANTIDRLCRLSQFLKNKSFRDMTTADIFSYLDSLRRTEVQDPFHKWIGTYNLSVVKILSFFKWIFDPVTSSENRITPTFLRNVRLLRRKEKTTCCARDLWTQEEDLLFIKYCPDKRLKLYHIMSRETSGRPHELLSLKIGDCIFHSSEDGRVYATITIGVGGKTIPRTVPIIHSIPFLKDWLQTDHPHGDSKNHYLFPSLNRKSIMRNKKLDSHSLNVLYSNMKYKLFPRILEDTNVPDSEKQKIKLLLEKPFFPYLRRHIGISEKARVLSDHSLRLFSGWNKSSKMPEVYTHELGDEISNQILELEGIRTKPESEKNMLISKICSNCQEPNRPDSRWCAKCQMILSYDTYLETITRNEEKEKEMRALIVNSEMNSAAIADLSDRFMKLMEDVQIIRQNRIN